MNDWLLRPTRAECAKPADLDDLCPYRLGRRIARESMEELRP